MNGTYATTRPVRRGITLRLRLTILATVLVGVALLLFSLAVYFTLERTLYSEVDSALVDRANVAIRSTGVVEMPQGFHVELPDVDAIAAGGAVLQAVVVNGEVARSQNLGRQTLPISREALNAATNKRSLFENVQVAGQDLRMYDVPLVYHGSPIGVLQVARPLAQTQQTLAGLRFVLIAVALGTVGICALFALLVARAALRPIDRLTREAEQIGSSQGFGRRVSARSARTNDEVGRLAAAFNAMLDRLQGAYAALQQANNRLEATLDSQRRFVADASHELRTPLTTVRGNASLLRRLDVLLPEDREAAIAQIVTESERMSRLVSDLLTLARADAGQAFERKPVAISKLIDEVAHQGRVLSEGKVSISVVRVGDVDACVLGDADKLRQLLLILVDNAIKYTPSGGSVTLGLRIEGGPGQSRTARISVVDTGPGIAPDDLPHIFERFYRADRARRAGGTGLGLAIGKWIAEAHGGSIGVESSPGAGSIFTVTLPAAPVALPKPAPEQTHTRVPVEAAAR